MNAYAQKVYDQIKKRDANEPEFLQAVGEVLMTLTPMLDQHPEYEKMALLERITEPERVIQFRVPVPPEREPVADEVPRLRADVQKQPHDAPDGRREGRQRF